MKLLSKPLVSLILPVKNEGEHIKNTIESAFSIKTECEFEIVVVDDDSQDGCCLFLRENINDKIHLIKTDGLGVANARNAGADHAKGDIFIFCDAHLLFEDYWIERLIKPIQEGVAHATNPGIGDVKNPKNIGYGYTWNENLEPKWNKDGGKDVYPSALLAGGCFAISRDVFENIDGFERGFRVWGRDDEEISLKLWLFGYKCFIVPNVTVLHVFRSDAPPFILKWDHVDYNLLRMAFLHFNYDRIYKSTRLIKYSTKTQLMVDLLKSDILEKQALYKQKRKYDDDWYMKKFNISF